ncbi:hypothetical protein ACOSQ2_030532 [Xanthoceras sorbifolium]
MNKSMLGGLEGLPQQDHARMASMINLRMYNSLVERCFTNCVNNFTHQTLQKQEETCYSMCVGMRFAELNSQAATPE